MRALEQHERGLAVRLAALAGFVDSIGFLLLGGLFVSFMSGNSTRLAASLSIGDGALALGALGLLAGFVGGAFLGAMAAGGNRGAPVRVLMLETALLLAAAVSASLGAPVGLTAGLMVVAMGVENAVFLRNGEVGVGLTYMTGALVKLGHALAAAARGGERWAFLPHLWLWAGLTFGAILGALAFQLMGGTALYLAAAGAGGLTLAMVEDESRKQAA
ncbi:YoaK family protein [Brevundimonas sp.]|uniref:YoaK family protein n=1 Tax=Brevundimonas sp. TaxID=1871086 RepID=UPI0034556916